LHSALKFVTPHQRHTREDEAIRIKRHDVYQTAKLAHPERWSKETRNWLITKVATLNPNKKLKGKSREEIVSVSMVA
jgi:putative transposase